MGKNILVIGSNSSIAKKLIDMELKEGNHIFSISRKGFELENTNFHHQILDVLEENIPEDFLPDSIDGMVYFPGTINLKPFKALKQNVILSDIRINVLGAVNVIQQVLKKLSLGSSVLLFSSVAVRLGMPYHSSVAISKGAVEGLTISLASELAPKVRVNCVAPSLTSTNMASRFIDTEEKLNSMKNRHPLKSIGQPEDLAYLISYLLSDKSKWVTGQVISVDGGLSNLKM